jgi:hypothetical protein
MHAWQHLINRPSQQSPAATVAGIAAAIDQQVDFKKIAAAQATCSDCAKITSGGSSLVFSDFNLGHTG